MEPVYNVALVSSLVLINWLGLSFGIPKFLAFDACQFFLYIEFTTHLSLFYDIT